MSTPGVKPYLWMLTGSGWFAAMVLFIDACKGDCDWQVVMVVRSGLATLFAVTLAVATRVPLAIPGSPTLWLRSVSGSLSMVCTFYALTHLPPSDVLVITNSFPIWVALFSWPAFGERPTFGVWAAVLCGVAGVAVVHLLGEHNTVVVHSDDPPAYAYTAAVFASVFTAVAMMGLNRLKGIPSLAVVVHFSAVSLLVCGACYFLFPRSIGNAKLADPRILFDLLMVGATATVGQVFLTKAFKGGAATKVSVVGLSQVVMVMAWEWAVNGRVFDEWQLLGTTLVLGPTGYLMLRERKRPPDRKPDDEPVVEEVAIE
jgi:drug/metabolite transporter (DMT)-like permease